MRRNQLTALLAVSAMSMALGDVGFHHYAPRRDIRPLDNETSKSKAKLVGNKRSKRRNKAKGQQA